MFSPTRSNLFANFKLHHPLPLTPRESKQLLNLLTTSFRQHLDAEHPAFRKNTAGPANSKRTPTNQHEKSRRRSVLEISQIPVDRHIQSMLSNPLFGYDTSVHILQDPLTPHARAMKVFDLALSKGLMTREIATTLLKTNMRTVKASSALDVQAELRKSQAGSKVLKWLVSSGEADKREFLDDPAFSTILVEHLVAENLQEVVWSWIKSSFEEASSMKRRENGKLDDGARRRIVQPLLQLVMAETNASHSLSSAYMCMSRAAGYLKGVPAPIMREVLYPAGRFLVNSTIFTTSSREAVSESAFESFYSLLPVMFSRKLFKQYAAHLQLLHPKPQVEPAILFLSELNSSYTLQVLEREVVQLGFDTAKYLLEHNRVSEALQVMDILRVRFPKELGVSQEKQLEEVRSEASTMELLEGLSLA